MKNNRTVIIIVFSILGVLLIWYFFSTGSSKKRYQWYEHYRADSDQPYGTLFMQKLLARYRPESKFIFNEGKSLKRILDDATARGNTDYVFIGQSIYLYEEDAKALVDFMKQGNDVFIASLSPPQTLLDYVYYKECGAEIEYISKYDIEKVAMNFFHDTLKTQTGYDFNFRFGEKDEPYAWRKIKDEIFCDATKSITPLGYFDTLSVNFVHIPVEKGNLYLHSAPLAFTNYSLTKATSVQYAESVFSHLHGNDIIWDEYSKVPLAGNKNGYNSPLYYIMQQPALKYAWWLLLITVILYVFFAAKRKQRVIPVLEVKSNTSLEYVNLISTLHYQNGNHLDMAKKKMKYFLYFVRSRYGINAEGFNEVQIKKLAEKAKMNVNDVQIIFDQYKFMESKFNDNIEPNRLLNLYHAIENFYQKCK